MMDAIPGDIGKALTELIHFILEVFKKTLTLHADLVGSTIRAIK